MVPHVKPITNHKLTNGWPTISHKHQPHVRKCVATASSAAMELGHNSADQQLWGVAKDPASCDNCRGSMTVKHSWPFTQPWSHSMTMINHQITSPSTPSSLGRLTNLHPPPSPSVVTNRCLVQRDDIAVAGRSAKGLGPPEAKDRSPPVGSEDGTFHGGPSS